MFDVTDSDDLSEHVMGVLVDLGGRKLCQSKCRPHIPFRLLQVYLALFGHNTQRGRQAAIGTA